MAGRGGQASLAVYHNSLLLKDDEIMVRSISSKSSAILCLAVCFRPQPLLVRARTNNCINARCCGCVVLGAPRGCGGKPGQQRTDHGPGTS